MNTWLFLTWAILLSTVPIRADAYRNWDSDSPWNLRRDSSPQSSQSFSFESNSASDASDSSSESVLDAFAETTFNTRSSGFGPGGEPNSPEIFRGQSSVNIVQNCINGQCITCVNGKCFKGGNYTSVHAIGSCPVTVCTEQCDRLVTAPDQCPICSCNDGDGVREPCEDNSDCPPKSIGCLDHSCVYSNVSSNLPTACAYAYQCPATEDCPEGSCVASQSGEHLRGPSCVFDSDCPSEYTCRRYTCWKGGPVHLPREWCIFDFDCPSGYKCQQMTCYKGGAVHSDAFGCLLDSECDDGFGCVHMTCVKNGTR